jgi:hypothetical protein
MMNISVAEPEPLVPHNKKFPELEPHKNDAAPQH